mmetsp:Transcript_13651/g.29149  ORF Transcript_13651/g.29149 Transcript_13651/m.29149 type:complete len:830 (+) Transcript_13651:248-2737(+)
MGQESQNPAKTPRDGLGPITQQRKIENPLQRDQPRTIHKIHSKLHLVKLFCLIATYRLANAWMLRTQFDPDEYWQTLEPAYCLAFGAHSKPLSGSTSSAGGNEDTFLFKNNESRECALTWEWTRQWSRQSSEVFSNSQSTSLFGRETGDDNSSISLAHTQQLSVRQEVLQFIERAMHGPVRSYVSILPTYWYYLLCRTLFDWAGKSYENIHARSDTLTDHETIGAWKTFWSQFIDSVRNGTRDFILRNATYMISKGPVFLHSVLVAAPTDLSVYLIAYHLVNLDNWTKSSVRGQDGGDLSCSWQEVKLWWPFWSLVCSMTSWFNGYALIRTYANSMEAACLAVGVALLAPELFGELHLTKTAGMSDISGNHRPQAKLAFVLGGLSACVRFTSLAAWIPMGILISIRSGMDISILSNGSSVKLYNHTKVCGTLIKLCAAFGLLGVLIGCCVDRWAYGFWAVPFLGNFHFNVILGNGSLYGTHPFLWYIYAGIPAVCGSMLPFLLFNLTVLFSNPSQISSNCNKINNTRIVLFGIIVPYVILHSFSEHKEFRFLLPMLPLICVLAADVMVELVIFMEDGVAPIDVDAVKNSDGLVKRVENDSRGKLSARSKGLFLVMIMLNYPHLLYLGMIHQRGPIAVNRYLTSVISERVQRNITGRTSQSIHYLMGCHSTPLYSHLHIPEVKISAWYLDCSPDCRSSSEEICESDAFLNDPLGFVKATYDHLPDGVCVDSSDGNTCHRDYDHQASLSKLPTFLVVMQNEAATISSLIEDWGMEHLGSIRHSISSLSRHNRHNHEYCLTSVEDGRAICHNPITFFSLIDVHFEHIEIYSI